ncbi:hypothetical protein BJV74DRAFT_774222, partial [Russula compacta]
PKTLNQAVSENLMAAKRAVERINSTQETNTTIWLNLRKLVLCIYVQQFLFKMLHNAYMIGEKWTNIPAYTHRGICSSCGVTESKQHILLKCNSPARSTIWDKAKGLWPHDQYEWPEISLGTILGIGSITLPDRRRLDQPSPSPVSLKSQGESRLLQILISEVSHLIWVLRCGRAINQENHNVQQIKAQWQKVINNRLTMDKLITTTIKCNKKAIQLTKATWEKTLERRGLHLTIWMQSREVF